MRNLMADVDVVAEPTRVVVVGGGAAGVITATHLLRAADAEHPVDVRIVEQRAELGPGLAYGTSHRLHTLNNFAARLSAVEGDPDHLLRWCAHRGVSAGPTSFLPRKTYGRYLTDVLDGVVVPQGSVLRRTRGVVTDVRDEGDELEVDLSCGWTAYADKVVLALGNPPPRRQPEYERWGDRYLPDPWDARLLDRVGAADEVLLLGTGLTMVDVVAMLQDASPGTRFTAVSRRGLLPSAHKRGSLRLHDIFDPGVASLDELLQRVRARIEELGDVGGDWRDVIDSVRVCANDLWRCFSPEDQDRFVQEVSRRWEIARHRMSPDMAELVDRLQQEGVLRVAYVDEVDVASFDRIVNCTGPSPVPTRGWNPLVDTLLERGMVAPHRLGLGLDLDPDGCVVDAEGRPHRDIVVAGAARRGLEWEVAAIPDLRQQAARLAAQVLGGVRTDAAAASGEEVVPA